jgi:hypothetical protein
MKITEQQLREILKEEIESILNEVELTPAMYNALKAQGRLPAGAKVKPNHAGASAQVGGQTVYAKGGKKAEKNFDDKTGKPLTDKGKELCAKNPECKKRHMSGGSSADGPSRTEMSKILGKNYLNMKRSLANIDKNAMMADEVLDAFNTFENLFLTFNKQYRSGR